MVFSKSFGYALRGILYVAMINKTRQRVQLGEIAGELGIPRHFLAKVMKRMVKENIIMSVRGAGGGFCINERTLQTDLTTIMDITGETAQFDLCVLRLRKCNSKNPCPLHKEAELLKKQWHELLTGTTVGDLLVKGGHDLMKSIAINAAPEHINKINDQ